jgi:GT2 family glycosyltransferase
MSHKLTIILVSFFSDNRIKYLLNKIHNYTKIVIIENSLSKKFKENIEKNYKNTKVIIPKKNLGNGGGINLAIKNIKTEFALYLDIDVKISQSIIYKLYKAGIKNKDWAIISPNLKGKKYKKESFINNASSKEIKEMNFVEGCALLFHLSTIKKLGMYDENFFLYYEENDLFYRCLEDKKKILLLNKVYIEHNNNTGSDKEYDEDIKYIRDWHLMWSKFYYYKKNFSFIRGIFETYKSFISAFLKTIYFYCINNEKYKKYFNRFSGLLNSYMGIKSWKRANIKGKYV